MSVPAATRTATPNRPPLWRDVRVLRLAVQVVVVVAVGALLAYLYDNLQANQRELDIPRGYDFLGRSAGFRIAYSDFAPGDTVWHALLVGLRNTVTVALVGIALTLVFGTLVGVARLSSNWLVRKAAGAYVEAVRNVPPLLVIIFVNSVALTTLPPIDEANEVAGGALLLSVREIGVVSLRDDGGAAAFALVLLAGIVAGLAFGWWRVRHEAATGDPGHRWRWGGAAFAAVAVGGYLALGQPVRLSYPEVVGRSVDGGIAMGLPFVSVLVGLVLYTTTHVAEIVRGSILSVPRGQTEAATALGLSSGQRLRYVVLPQAFRVAVPPAVNQFLNLTKNTSLGVAVAYAETMYVTNTVIGNGNPAIQSILVAMGLYLVLSLAISLVGNLASRRLRLVER
ncbi:MAG TPA: ABC transporter permease subunit [Acidimicrobiales bacterium]|jgi:general L-amino acid transport system permease protein|nr:ABC transporter permease subunit [Acidimicrobiales bacterium]